MIMAMRKTVSTKNKFIVNNFSSILPIEAREIKIFFLIIRIHDEAL